MAEEIVIRAHKPEDINFIYSTMLRGLYYASDSFYSMIDKAIFFKNYEEVLSAILKQSDTVLCIACLKSEPDIILGYALMRHPDSLHYVYVKPAWRSQSIATRLCSECLKITTITHLTPQMDSLRMRKQLKFNPFF